MTARTSARPAGSQQSGFRSGKSDAAKAAPKTEPKNETNSESGIVKGHEIEGADELGFKQLQVWPARDPKKGFLGFAQLQYYGMVIRDCAVRERKEDGAIYLKLPAKLNTSSNEWKDVIFFLGEAEREMLAVMTAEAYNRAIGAE